ncbi:electron transport complex subunit RsxC [Methylocaldum szegediense]|uniref:Ion-translocating oxidoreductase complex subunit C n=1 Tax=Methylocaldum szegediense TaxID=73780 RepID=A0ABM9I8W6_9GAMM|nr:electron transport complex subunit RsxC [Methylocaldum szegediense]CAI8965253.1 Ion-translocating oxidoreductase complex subunit C [Methylocaldum szegediense]
MARTQGGERVSLFKLWTFHGGLQLEGHKRESSSAPLVAPIPKRLVFPLQQRSGEDSKPVVAPGDRVLKGQVIARDDHPFNPPIHASSSGIVQAIEDLPLPHPSGLSGSCIVIETDGEDAAVGFTGIADYKRCSPEELRRRIHEAGIVGLGGAAFPTSVKVSPGEDRKVDTLILNGAECEPYITCDDSLLRQYPEDVLEGAKILLHILRAEHCLLAVESDMPEAFHALETAKQQGRFNAIRLVRVPAIYPIGGEKQLISVLTDREVPTRGLPADIGIVCQNVGTAAAVYNAVVRGIPLISRIVTVTGRGVRRPQNVLARIGTPLADLIRQCGGYTDEAERLVLGGPLMGFAVPTDQLPLTKSVNCLLVAGRNELIGEKRSLPCIRCGTCADVCPVSLLPQQLYWYSRSNQTERALDYNLFDCIECGCCDVVCPSHIPLVQYFRAAKSKAIAKRREREKAEHARRRYESRQARKELEKREWAESIKRKKESLETGKAPEILEAIERAKRRRAEKTAPPRENATSIAHDQRETIIAADRVASINDGHDETRSSNANAD